MATAQRDSAGSPSAPARPLAGRHAVVTGGSRGIGAAVPDTLARQGADVTVMGRNAASREAEADRLASRHGTRAAAVGWLCLPSSASITGQSIVIAGGELM